MAGDVVSRLLAPRLTHGNDCAVTLQSELGSFYRPLFTGEQAQVVGDRIGPHFQRGVAIFAQAEMAANHRDGQRNRYSGDEVKRFPPWNRSELLARFAAHERLDPGQVLRREKRAHQCLVHFMAWGIIRRHGQRELPALGANFKNPR